jgi:hypothetical protein
VETGRKSPRYNTGLLRSQRPNGANHHLVSAKSATRGVCGLTGTAQIYWQPDISEVAAPVGQFLPGQALVAAGGILLDLHWDRRSWGQSGHALPLGFQPVRARSSHISIW